MSHRNNVKACLVVALAGGALSAAACGESTSEATKQPAARPGKADVTRYLMRDGEQPGFRVVGSAMTDSPRTFEEITRLTKAETRRLRRDGMGHLVYQPIEGPRTGGVTSVTLFATAAGAEDWLEQEQSAAFIRRQLGANPRIRRFTVPGLPGARGWAAAKGDHHLGNVFWVQGRCLLIIGNEGPGPFAGTLAMAARAIHERTGGRCP